MQQGLVVFKSNDDLQREEQEAAAKQVEAENLQRQSVETSLSAHIKQFWEKAKRHKQPIENQMLDNVRQIAGKYSDAKLEEIRAQGLPAIYMQLTSVKCRAAKSWIRDVLMPAGDKPWSLEPTKKPEMPGKLKIELMQRVSMDAEQFMRVTGQQITPEQFKQVAEKAKQQIEETLAKEADVRAERMSEVIQDQLTEGNWETAFNDIISDIVDFPAAILKAPVLRNKKKLKWEDGQGLNVQTEIQPEVERVNPFSFYPEPGIVHPNEGDCIEVHEYSASELYNLIGVPGYKEDGIRRVLQQHAREGLSNWSRESLQSSLYKARGHHSTGTFEEKTIESLEYWGAVQGRMLQEWGMSMMEVPDPDAIYSIMAELIGTEVICVRLNPDPLGDKPYSKACFEDIPGSFWGLGVPDLIRDCQDICNAAARSLVANMGISSGPQVAINTPSLPPGETIDQMYPWKIWQLDFSKGNQGSRPPIEFFQPNANTAELMNVYKEFSALADEYSGIPSYSYGVGTSVGGAGKTASGLSMLMNAASKAIKNVVKHIDSGIVAPTVFRFYVFNMLWNPDESIKGDAQVIARGALSLVAKEQNQMRLQEVLNQTANPIDMQIIGLDGRAELLRKTLQGVDVSSDFIPSDEELNARLSQQAPPAPAPAPQGVPQQ